MNYPKTEREALWSFYRAQIISFRTLEWGLWREALKELIPLWRN